MPDSAPAPPSPPYCPQCHEGHGVPTAAATVPGNSVVILVTYRCDACAHEWQAAREIPSVFAYRSA